MFSRVATVFTFLFFVLPLLAATTAIPRTDVPSTGGGGSTTTQCNTGDVQCCNQILSADDSAVGLLAGLLGIVLGSVEGLVGLNCISLVGGASCNAQAACCTDNSFSGLINLGCSPINISL